MNSNAPSGSGSNTSEFVRYSEERKYLLYKLQIIEGMKRINQDLLQIDKNLNNLAEKSGPFKSQLSGLLAALPMPNSEFINMETD